MSALKSNYAFNPIAEQALRTNQTIVPQRVNAALVFRGGSVVTCRERENYPPHTKWENGMRSLVLVCSLLIVDAASASPIVVDANNRLVGFYHGIGGPSNEELGVSSKGYRFSFNRFNGRLSYPEGASRPFFTTSNCTGPAYLKNPGAIISVGLVLPGAYDDQNPQTGTAPLYYMPQAPLPPVQMLMSGSFWRFDGGTLTCVTDSPGPLEPVVPLLPNDPSATGIESGTFPAPMRVISSWLFRDGFEGALHEPLGWASSIS